MRTQQILRSEGEFLYSELSEIAKIKGRNEVLELEILAYNKNVSKFKALIKKDIQHLINDKYKLPYLIKMKNHHKKLFDVVYLEKFIIYNICMFTIDGTYTYIKVPENKSIYSF